MQTGMRNTAQAFRHVDLVPQHCPLPLTLSEELIYPFQWYLQGEIREGMRFQDEIYGLIARFDANQRTVAYELACELASGGGQVVVTVANSTETRQIWLNLRHWDAQRSLG